MVIPTITTVRKCLFVWGRLNSKIVSLIRSTNLIISGNELIDIWAFNGWVLNEVRLGWVLLAITIEEFFKHTFLSWVHGLELPGLAWDRVEEEDTLSNISSIIFIVYTIKGWHHLACQEHISIQVWIFPIEVFHLQQVNPVNELLRNFSSRLHIFACIGQVCTWCNCKEFINFLKRWFYLRCIFLHTKSVVHLLVTHWVTNIGQFSLSSIICDVVDLSNLVISGHFVRSEIPKLWFWDLWLDMASLELCSSITIEPNIKTSFEELNWNGVTSLWHHTCFNDLKITHSLNIVI